VFNLNLHKSHSVSLTMAMDRLFYPVNSSGENDYCLSNACHCVHVKCVLSDFELNQNVSRLSC